MDNNKLKFSATVNETIQFEDLNPDELNVTLTKPGTYHLISDQESISAEVLESDFLNKTFKIRLRGTNYTVQLSDPLDKLVKELGLGLHTGQKVSEIKAPMPGLVLQLSVEEGQEVKKDDPLVILEAMKMENVIKSPGEGVVKSIPVKKGDAVEKGAILIEME